MIPNIIHQIWIQGYNEIPENLLVYYKDCQKINNTFEHILWDNEKIQELLIKYFEKKYLDTYNNYSIFAQKADFARYAILYIYGGVYLDMDTICKKNLTEFIKHQFFYTSYLFPNYFKRYLNGIIGSCPKHPIFLTIFQKIFERSNIKSVTNSTGTGLFYDSINEYIKNNPNHDLTMIERKYLAPCSMFNLETCQHNCQDCYIVHGNYSSWSSSLRLFQQIWNYKVYILLSLIIVILIIIVLIKKL